MLDKLVIHLKNRIFFKSVTYIIIIILLGSLVPTLQKELFKSLERKTKAQVFLNQANTQLNSIVEFEEQIAQTNVKYKELLNNSGKNGCADRTNLIQNLAILSEKYHLYEPIKIDISRLFETAITHSKNSQIKLHDYEAIISFMVASEEEALTVSNDICTLLPLGTQVLSTLVKKNEVLTPEIIETLSEAGAPGLINVTIKSKLREIVYEK